MEYVLDQGRIYQFGMETMTWADLSPIRYFFRIDQIVIDKAEKTTF